MTNTFTDTVSFNELINRMRCVGVLQEYPVFLRTDSKAFAEAVTLCSLCDSDTLGARTERDKLILFGSMKYLHTYNRLYSLLGFCLIER